MPIYGVHKLLDKNLKCRRLISDFLQRQLLEHFRVYLSIEYNDLFVQHLADIQERIKKIRQEKPELKMLLPDSTKVNWREFGDLVLQRLDCVKVQHIRESDAHNDDRMDQVSRDKDLIDLMHMNYGDMYTTIHNIEKNELEEYILDLEGKIENNDQNDVDARWLKLANLVYSKFDILHRENRILRREKKINL